MKTIKYLSSITFAVVLFLSSCKPIQAVQNNSYRPLPESFENIKDTVSVAAISWKQFFSDPELVSLIDTALKNNPDIQIAFQRLQASQADVLSSTGALKPVVNGMAAAGVSKFSAYTMDGAGNKGTEIYNGKEIPAVLPDYFIGLQSTWEADIWGKLRNRKNAAVARYLANVEGRNWVITNLITEIANSYYELMALDRQMEIIDTTIALQENALEMVKVQKETARANELAVKQFEGQLIGFKSIRWELLQQITENESRINFLVGRYPQTVTRNGNVFVQPLPVKVDVGIPSALLQNRPDIRQAELELLASKADVIAAKAAFYPTVNINGSVGFQAFKVGLLATAPQALAYNLFGGLTAPLINRSGIKAEFNRANARQLEALANYSKTILNGYTEVYTEMKRISNLQEINELKTRQVDILTQSIEPAKDLFKTGRATYLEILLTQQNALNPQLELINTKKNQYQAMVNIYKALGGGWK